MATTFSIINLKGGVGKTASALNIGYLLAKMSYRVLLVDLDAQANLTSRCNFAVDEEDGNVQYIEQAILKHVNHDEHYTISLQRAVDTDGLYLFPSSINMAGIDARLSELPKAERPFVLHNILQPCKAEFDFIVLDCPPGAGLMAVNIIIASDHIFVPVLLEDDSLNGVISLKKLIRMVYPKGGKDISGIFVNRFDVRTRLALSVYGSFQQYLRKYMMRSVIRKNDAIGMAARNYTCITKFDPSCHAAEDFANLVEELLKIIAH